jgi:hypothetical protein
MTVVSSLNSLYYCSECKKVFPTLDKLLFVEENTVKGFCSEECIEFFYSPMLKHYEELLYAYRTQLNLQDESIHFEISDHDLIEEVIRSPSEIWRNENDLHEELFSYIKHFIKGSVVILCTVLNAEPAFIFLITKTSSQNLLSKFRIGERQTTETDNGIDELILDLESKKSYLLADLLSKMNDSDIPFEDYSLFEYCLSETQSSPDETFECKDREGDLLTTTIKSFSKNNIDFFYIIISFKNMIIFSFPTKDMNLYAEYRSGKQIFSNLKN